MKDADSSFVMLNTQMIFNNEGEVVGIQIDVTMYDEFEANTLGDFVDQVPLKLELADEVDLDALGFASLEANKEFFEIVTEADPKVKISGWNIE